MEKKPYQTNRPRDYYLHHRQRSMNRKKKIAKFSWFSGYNHEDMQEYLNDRIVGQFAKGKVHCSCRSCSAKSREVGYKISDKKKIGKSKYQIKAYKKGEE